MSIFEVVDYREILLWHEGRIIVKHFADLTSAETYAVKIMEEMPFRWQRGEWNEDYFEYIRRGDTGSCDVYVRISPGCHRCQCGKLPNFVVRSRDGQAEYRCRDCVKDRDHYDKT